MVKKETVIGKVVEFPHRVEDLLDGRFGIRDEQARTECRDKILKISTDENMDKAVQNILYGVVEDQALETAKYQLKDWVKKAEYAQMGVSYWEHMRKMFIQIIRQNICKANHIQNGKYNLEEDKYKQYFEQLDLIEILNSQNLASQDEQNGFIWVLSTCVFVIPEYNFSLVTA